MVIFLNVDAKISIRSHLAWLNQEVLLRREIFAKPFWLFVKSHKMPPLTISGLGYRGLGLQFLEARQICRFRII
jgi:hypothetical protein